MLKVNYTIKPFEYYHPKGKITIKVGAYFNYGTATYMITIINSKDKMVEIQYVDGCKDWYCEYDGEFWDHSWRESTPEEITKFEEDLKKNTKKNVKKSVKSK